MDRKVFMKYWSIFFALVLINTSGCITAQSGKAQEADIVIYGGTSAAITSAVQAKRMGKSVVIVSPDKHLGGLSSGGLGWTDTGNKSVIGGISREFYQRIYNYYDKPETWKWQKKLEYGNKGQGTTAMDGKERTMWIFEPHIAEQVFEDFIAEYKIPVYRDEWLDRKNGVKKETSSIRAITTLSGKTFKGKVFIDATYEGDLMAAVGVSYHVGREANSVYNENWNGIQVGVLHHGHHVGKRKVSPYKKPGDLKSGVLPRISTLIQARKATAITGCRHTVFACALKIIQKTASPSRNLKAMIQPNMSC